MIIDIATTATIYGSFITFLLLWTFLFCFSIIWESSFDYIPHIQTTLLMAFLNLRWLLGKVNLYIIINNQDYYH